MEEERLMMKLAIFCYGCGVAAIVYMAVSGNNWPMAFVGTLAVFGIIFGSLDLYERNQKDDNDV